MSNQRRFYTLALDIGGSFIKSALVSSSYRIIEKKQIPTPQTKAKLNREIISLINSYKDYKWKKIGIGCPGPADYQKGIILSPPNLAWKNFNLKQLLTSLFPGKKIIINNDANCFTLAEARLGCGQGKKTVVGITLGTGIGGGVVIDNKIFHGKNNAGEFGHFIINKKTVENATHQHPLVKKLGWEKIILSKTATKQSKKIDDFWQYYGRSIGKLITNITYAYDPDIIIIGGGVSKAFVKFYPWLKHELQKNLLIKPPIVVKSKLLHPGIIGAALIAK